MRRFTKIKDIAFNLGLWSDWTTSLSVGAGVPCLALIRAAVSSASQAVEEGSERLSPSPRSSVAGTGERRVVS